MTDETGRLVLVTGARAAGKTAVAHALARYLPRAVHLDGEVLAGFVVTGSAPAVLPLSRDALEQVYLRWSAAIAVAETYDVVVVPREGRTYQILAEATDRTGWALAQLATRPDAPRCSTGR